jgi:tetratricopeptide (TPR) repeat protein
VCSQRCELGHYEDALADATQSLKLHEPYAKGHSRKGAALARLLRWTQARAAYQRALELEPDSALYQKNLQDCSEALRKANLADAASASTPAAASPASPSNSDDPVCATCGKPATLTCSRCEQVPYCGRACQTSAWKQHKKVCIPLADSSAAGAPSAAAAAAVAAKPLPLEIDIPALVALYGLLPLPPVDASVSTLATDQARWRAYDEDRRTRTAQLGLGHIPADAAKLGEVEDDDELTERLLLRSTKAHLQALAVLPNGPSASTASQLVRSCVPNIKLQQWEDVDELSSLEVETRMYSQVALPTGAVSVCVCVCVCVCVKKVNFRIRGFGVLLTLFFSFNHFMCPLKARSR